MDLSDLVDGPLPDVLLEHVPALVVQEDAPIDAPLRVELRLDADEVPMQGDDGEIDVDIDMVSSSSSSASALSLRLSSVSEECEGLPLAIDEESCISDPCALPVLEGISCPDFQSAKIATAKFFRKMAPFQVQAQVVLVNAVDTAMRIPKELLSQALWFVSASHPKGNVAYAFISKVVGLGEWRLSNLFRRVRDNGWKPCPEPGGALTVQDRDRQSVENAVRTALANMWWKETVASSTKETSHAWSYLVALYTSAVDPGILSGT